MKVLGSGGSGRSRRRSGTAAGPVQLVLAGLALVGTMLTTDARAQTTAFVNANVVPMDDERVLAGYTVVVQDGRIAEIGPTDSVVLPASVVAIDAAGAWLIPGLADMHAHLTADPSPDFMRWWLAQGVTTLRDLNATPEHLVWRDDVLDGRRVGPTLYLSGPEIVGLPPYLWYLRAEFNVLLVAGPALLFLLLAGVLRLSCRRGGFTAPLQLLRRVTRPVAAVLLAAGAGIWWSGVVPLNTFTQFQYPMAFVTDTEAQARDFVRRTQAMGFDAAKIYDFMPRAAYLGALEEARAIGLYTVGHLDDQVTVEEALAAGLNEIAHVDEYLTAHLEGEMSVFEFEPVPVNLSTVPRSVAATARRDVTVVSNMVADENAYEYLEIGPAYFDRPEYRHVRPATKQQWKAGRVVAWQGTQEWRRTVAQPFYAELTRQLHEARVPMLVGTDVSIDGIVPEHLHRDIELLVASGFSAYEALHAATVNAGQSVARMGSPDRFGTVAVGQRADLVLLARNPLEDVTATRDRVGVMARGVWYPQARLDALVEEFVATY